MDFEKALKLLKEGKKLHRTGWNGKETFVTLIPGGTARWLGFKMQDCLGFKTADNFMQPGWVPTQNDLLSGDWKVID